MNIGIICYASVGGSGIVATELAKALAARGHDVHVLSADTPFRLGSYQPGLTFHRVTMLAYPLFREPEYLLALASRTVQVSRDAGLDIVHAHYAVPHATAAYLAKQILSSPEAEGPEGRGLRTTGRGDRGPRTAGPGDRGPRTAGPGDRGPRTAGSGDRGPRTTGPGDRGPRSNNVPRVITTLHGTDITLVGSDHSYAETVAFSIDRSDGVTAVSQSLRADTYRTLSVRNDIVVIPNFLDCDVYRRVPNPALRARYCPAGSEKLVIHVSNFRPVKRTPAVVDVFARIAAKVRARLLLVGDGPDLAQALDTAKALGVAKDVEALGEQDQTVPLLSIADLFLLPSAQESFGLAALEAMACRVPVVASRVGGLHEVIDHGATGFLHQADDLQGMADSGITLLTDPDLHARVAAAGRRVVRERFCRDLIVPRYEEYYAQVLAK